MQGRQLTHNSSEGFFRRPQIQIEGMPSKSLGYANFRVKGRRLCSMRLSRGDTYSRTVISSTADHVVRVKSAKAGRSASEAEPCGLAHAASMLDQSSK